METYFFNFDYLAVELRIVQLGNAIIGVFDRVHGDVSIAASAGESRVYDHFGPDYFSVFRQGLFQLSGLRRFRYVCYPQIPVLSGRYRLLRFAGSFIAIKLNQIR